RIFLAAGRRPGHLGYIEIATRVYCARVRRHELARLLAGKRAADPLDEVALDRQHAHARADVRYRLVHREVRGQFADEEEVTQPRRRRESARTVQVVELPEVRAIVVEDLHAR